AGLLRRAVALDPIAMTAGSDHIHPSIAATAGYRPDVIPRQTQGMEFAAAVGAEVAVAPEQLAIVQRRYLIESLESHGFAANGDDGMAGDAGPLPSQAGNAAIGSESDIAKSPCHQILGIVEACLLPRDPAVRDTVVIQGEDQRDINGH